MSEATFKFLKPGKLIDGDLELVPIRSVKADSQKHHCPWYEFSMTHTATKAEMGKIRLRIGSARELRYPGHIGFEVKTKFRGHRYASRSCQLLFPLASAHGLPAVWLTTNPNNTASIRTCLKTGAKYVETVRIPRDHEMAKNDTRDVRRYRVAV